MLKLVLISALLLQAPSAEQQLIDSLGIRDYFLDADGRRNPDLFRRDSLSAEGKHLLSRLVAEYNGLAAVDDGFIPYHLDSRVDTIGVRMLEGDVLPVQGDSCIVFAGEQECLWRDTTVTRTRVAFEIPSAWEGRKIYVRMRDCGKSVYAYLNGEFLGFFKDNGEFAQMPCAHLARVGENHLVLKIFGEYQPEKRLVVISAGAGTALKMCRDFPLEGNLRGARIHSRGAGEDVIERILYTRLNAVVLDDLQTEEFYSECIAAGISTYWKEGPVGQYLEEDELMQDPVPPALTQMRFLGQQFAFEDCGGGSVNIINRSSLKGSEGARFTATLMRGGEIIRNRPLMVRLGPGESKVFSTFGADDMRMGDEYYVRLTARGEDWSVISEGELRLGGEAEKKPASLKGTKLSVRQSGGPDMVISNQTASFLLDVEKGVLKSACLGKTEFLSAPMVPQEVAEEYEVRHDGSEVVIDFGTFKYILSPSGAFRAYGAFSFGTAMKDALYYGRGPMNNVPQMSSGSFVGKYAVPAATAGPHCDVRYLQLSDGRHRLRISAAEPFFFSASGGSVTLSKGEYLFETE